MVFPEGEHDKILRAAKILVDRGIAHPILLARRQMIADKLRDLDLPEDQVTIIHNDSSDNFESYAEALHRRRRRQGVTMEDARKADALPQLLRHHDGRAGCTPMA